MVTTEAERIAAVRRYDVLDTPPDGSFDRITRLAARLLDVPIAIVSIVDTDRIWFKSHHGVDATEIERAPGLCASAILGREPWLVENAAMDARTLANPLVAGDFGLRFYAGVPLTTHDGFNLGTLCVIDTAPRRITAEEVATLSDLAAVVVDELELRLSSQRSVALEAELRQSAECVARTLQDSLQPPQLPSLPGIDVAAYQRVAQHAEVGGDFYDVIPTDLGCAAVVGDSVGKGVGAAALTATARWTLRTVAADIWTPADAVSRLNDVLLRAYDDPERYCTVAVASLLRRARGGADLILSLGGHPQPLLLRRNGETERLGDTGPAPGWSARAQFTDTTAELLPGDALVLFTDGLLDALGGRYGEDAALHHLLAGRRDATADEVAQILRDAVDQRHLADDAALLVLRVA